MSDDATMNQRFPCGECHAGHVNMQHVVYYTWVCGELITVPDFPAWICDVCGAREYDRRALSWLNIILSPDTGKKKGSSYQQKHLTPKSPPLQPDI
jgi:YgiT-type zinc finger domain-containing protein